MLSAQSSVETSTVASEKATPKTSPVKEVKKNRGDKITTEAKNEKKSDVKKEVEKRRSGSVISRSSERSLKGAKSSTKAGMSSPCALGGLQVLLKDSGS